MTNVFAIIGIQELFYDQVPSELKSSDLSLYLSIIGAGNFLTSFLILVIEKITGGNSQHSWFSNDLNRARVDYFYWVLVGLSVIALLANIYLTILYYI